MILEAFWFLLPAAFANMAPIIARTIPLCDTPINKKALGGHKTWRGFIAGIILAIAVVYVMQEFGLSNYANIYLAGFLLGFGALLGDSIKSYFKRKKGIKPGHTWPVFDQIDWEIGSLILISLYFNPGLKIAITALIIYPLLHVAVNLIAYYAGIRKVKY